MPSNIFATTGTNVSVLFLDKSKEKNEVVLMDASNLGTIVKEGRSQKTLLTDEDEDLIINSFKTKKNIEHFSHVVKLEKIISNNYSLGASQYAAAWDPSAITRKSNSSFTDETFDSQIQVLLDRKSEALKREED